MKKYKRNILNINKIMNGMINTMKNHSLGEV